MSETEILKPEKTAISHAASLLRVGNLVAFPTETVYGLGADACNDHAVALIFKAKDRPQFNPLIVHVADLDAARNIAIFNETADWLAAAFWPGPLTLVLPRQPDCQLSALVSAGLDTVAIRMPAHPLAQKLLQSFGRPIAAPSANPSGRVSPTRADHVLQGLQGRIAAILDGGPCDVGLESTIIGFDPLPTLLRPGGLPTEAIEACIGGPLTQHATEDTPNAPGQLASHYAPYAPLRLNARTRRSGELLLGFGPHDCDLNLSASGDLTEAAANLFQALRTLDAKNGVKIAVTPIPDHGLGRAINDRLQRAAAPRP